MDWYGWLWVIFTWSVVGGIICVALADKSHADGWELCNPYWVYQYNRHVNWFGAIFLALLYNLACPFGAICYWFYKLCTVRRN